MPHCIVEYSSDLTAEVEISGLVETIHHSSLNSGLFSEDSIKVRAISSPAYLVGGQKNNFIHVTVKLFAGRTADQKQQLGQLVLDDLRKLVPTVESISVEIVDLAKEYYK